MSSEHNEVSIFSIEISNEDKQVSVHYFVSENSQKYIDENTELFNRVLCPEASVKNSPVINYDLFRCK